MVAPVVAAVSPVAALASAVLLPDLPIPLAVVMGMPDLAAAAVVAGWVAVPVVALAVARQRSLR